MLMSINKERLSMEIAQAVSKNSFLFVFFLNYWNITVDILTMTLAILAKRI